MALEQQPAHTAAGDAPQDEASTPLRFVTAASLFDGHDAAINIMRRILQSLGTEVIHLGHDRSAADVVRAAIEEDAHGIAVSSYQGGHVEYFSYMVELLREAGRSDIRVFGGGGGTITDKEIALLHERGVERIYSVEDGRRLGLVGMIEDMRARAARASITDASPFPAVLSADEPVAVAQALSWVENLAALAESSPAARQRLDQERVRLSEKVAAAKGAPIIGITGTGGAGKSSLTDELIRRFIRRYPERRFAVLSVDPSRRRTGGALLGDRIRMNAVAHEHVFMRSMATRQAHSAVSGTVRDALLVMQAAGYDLVILETAGIGQSGSEVVDLSDLSLYVMTPEFGAPTQLEKIDMLDYADLIGINKGDKQGADDAVRHVRKQVQRNRAAFDKPVDELPVYRCTASRFGDEGVNTLFDALNDELGRRDAREWVHEGGTEQAADVQVGLPGSRVRYLSEISDTLRRYRQQAEDEAQLAWRADGVRRALQELGDDLPEGLSPYVSTAHDAPEISALRTRYNELLKELGEEARALLADMSELRERYTGEENAYEVRGREIRVKNYRETLSGNQVPRVILPQNDDWKSTLRWRRMENLPGHFPYTAGVFPFKREGEDPTRMFAGEGTPERTNRRFHFLSQGQPAARLSTAFDSVTLYGRDPDLRPDIFGKVGNSGVSVATLDDAKRLYSGFDLCAPSTSVSMTINGPAPMVLALFLNTAIDQAVERRLRESGRWESAQEKIRELCGGEVPTYRADDLPEGHDGTGLGLLGVSGADLIDEAEYNEIAAGVLSAVRGTVQADILKEDQAQNTCIFSTDFALKMMGDIQEFFVDHNVRNFYSVSISGYHIAEAGANPITQLAFTLANGFTIVEYYRARGMKIDDFARNLSFFFSNGIDPEYSVIGRVARRIWAVAMKELYGASPRSQQLKYHIQTSGRSLHAQEIQFNDIRTTLQALYAIADNCNSLHTNAYDEAITTPTQESVRRALAIQLILNREFGLFFNENPSQGAYLTEYLTDVVEEAVLAEFDRLTERGGVLGAMELMYQRSRIQEESMEYEHRKHSGDLPIIGVNTFVDPAASEGVVEVEMARSSDDEKKVQIGGVHRFQQRNDARARQALADLQRVALEGGNIFAELMKTARVASLGQMTRALFDVGGQYRRNM